MRFNEEQLVWGVLALVVGYILYTFFFAGGGIEGLSNPPKCTWATPVTIGKIPSMGISDFLSGYSYTTTDAAKAQCSIEPDCVGILGTTSTIRVADTSSAGYHPESRTYWKLSKSKTTVQNTDPAIQYIEKKVCTGGDVPTSDCTFNETGMADRKPKVNTLGTKYSTLLSAKVGCSGNSKCEGIDSRPDGFFYLSDSSTVETGTGYTFFKKISCPTAQDEFAGDKDIAVDRAKYKAEEDKRAKDLLDAADWLAKNKTLSPADFTKAWEKKYGSVDSTVTEEEWLKWVTGTTTDKGTDSKNRAIDAVGAAAKDATSTLGSVSGMSGMNGKWNQGPKGSVGDSDKWSTPGDAYILKSSMVPCTCTTHSMGCERHSGSHRESFAPGDLDGNFQYRIQPQSGLMRPFSQAFLNQGEPTGFLNTCSAFA
jgi:hypothetical protein